MLRIDVLLQDIAENGADFAHLGAVHGPTIFLSDYVPWLARHSWTNVIWRPHCSYSNDVDTEAEVEPTAEVCVKLNDSASMQPIANGNNHHHHHHPSLIAENSSNTKKEKHKAGMQMHHSLVLLDRFTVLDLDVHVEQIGPGYVELLISTSLGPMCILQTVTPLEPLLQRVTHLIFSPPLLAPYTNLIFLGECLQFERDVAIWNHKQFERQPILVREDRAILAYRRWYSQFYSAHSPTYQTAMKTLQW